MTEAKISSSGNMNKKMLFKWQLVETRSKALFAISTASLSKMNHNGLFGLPNMSI